MTRAYISIHILCGWPKYSIGMSSRYEQASLVDDPSSEKHDDKLEPQEEYSLVREVLIHSRTIKHRLVRMHVLRYHVMIKNSE